MAATQDKVQIDLALRVLENADRLRPGHSRAYYMTKASCLAARKDDKKAEAEAARARAEADRVLPTTAFDFFLIGQKEYKSKQYRAAIQDFESALGRKPDHFWAKCLQAICYIQTGECKAAKASLDGCLTTDPDFAWLYLLRGFASGQIAAEDFKKLAKTSVGREADRLKKSAEFEFGQAEDDLQEALKRLTSTSADDLQYTLLVNRGLIRFERGLLDQAAADYQEAIRLKKDRYFAYASLAQVYDKQGKIDLAVEQFTHAINVASKPVDWAPLYRGRAKVLQASGENDAARRELALSDLDKAILYEKRDNTVLAVDHTNRGNLLYRDKHFEDALKESRRALEIEPRYPDAHVLQVKSLLKLRRYDELFRSCDVALAMGKKSAVLYEVRGLAHVARHEYPAAIRDYGEALEVRPDDAGLLAERGWAYLMFESPKLALVDFEAAIKLNPADGDAYNGRGTARALLGDHAAAVADAHEAVRRGEASPDQLQCRADLRGRGVGRVRRGGGQGTSGQATLGQIRGDRPAVDPGGTRTPNSRRAGGLLERNGPGRPGLEGDPPQAQIRRFNHHESVEIQEGWNTSPRNRINHHSSRLRGKRRMALPSLETFEPRLLLASGAGFIQGFVLDSSSQPVGGATVDLWDNSGNRDPGDLLATTTTNSSGYYNFDGYSLVAGTTYQITESAASYSSSVESGDIQTTVNPATAIAGDTAIQVTVENLSTQSFTLDFTGEPYPLDTAYLELNASSDNQASPGNSILENGDTVGGLDVELAGNLGNVATFQSVCADLLHGVSVGMTYPVSPSLTPNPTYNTSLTANIGELGYLYNEYALTNQTGSPENNAAVNGAGLQLAIWALEYNQTGSLNLKDVDSSLPYAVLQGSTAQNIINAANAYLSAAAGNSEDVYFLTVNQPPGPGHGQGMLSTDLLNFTDTARETGPSVPSLNTTPGGTVVLGSGVGLTDTAVLSGGSDFLAGDTITFTLYGPNNTAVDTETVPVTGNGTYTTPTAYVPSEAGTYEWAAAFSGDANNLAVSSPPTAELEVVSAATPTISTSQQPATAIVGTSIADQATVSGGYNPTGTVTFNLYGNSNGTGTRLYTDADVGARERRGNIGGLHGNSHGHGLLGGHLQRRQRQRLGHQRHRPRAGDDHQDHGECEHDNL